MRKISSRHILDEDGIIERIRALVKNDAGIKRKFKEYGVKLNIIDDVSVSFADLDVSAKTKNLEIYLNRKLLDSEELEGLAAYLAHEMIHFLQQKTGQTGSSSAKDYLDKDTEVESFEAQINYKREHEGKQEAREYVDSLLNYHGYVGKKRKEKKKELMGAE